MNAGTLRDKTFYFYFFVDVVLPLLIMYIFQSLYFVNLGSYYRAANLTVIINSTVNCV